VCVPHKCIGKTCPPIGSYKTGVDLGARFMNLFLFVKADEHKYTLVMLAIKNCAIAFLISETNFMNFFQV
jgi:hypothetical protein